MPGSSEGDRFPAIAPEDWEPLRRLIRVAHVFIALANCAFAQQIVTIRHVHDYGAALVPSYLVGLVLQFGLYIAVIVLGRRVRARALQHLVDLLVFLLGTWLLWTLPLLLKE